MVWTGKMVCIFRLKMWYLFVEISLTNRAQATKRVSLQENHKLRSQLSVHMRANTEHLICQLSAE